MAFNKISRLFTVLLLAAVFTTACSEEETSNVIITDNPYDLNSQSDLTLQLAGLSEISDCVTVNYPVTVITYLTAFEIAETIVINSDTELISFFDGLDEGENFAFQFPLTISGFENEQLTINSNEEFTALMQGELAECEAAAACITDNTVFNQLYNLVKSLPEVTEEFTMDALTHEYTFTVNTAGTICSIGYKSEEMTQPIVYLIEILNADGGVLYTGNHTFTSTAIEYVSITPIEIEADMQYTIRRTVTGTDAGTGIGTILVRSQNTGPQEPILPIQNGVITVLNSRYYTGEITEQTDLYSLPQIDFVFKPE
ncbi:MAG: hypothetical protein EOO45_21025 [Flavobacterium sp.]|nr:MAG: hypothetical protein EOO45_21025 [Flavobacterium sp.]